MYSFTKKEHGYDDLYSILAAIWMADICTCVAWNGGMLLHVCIVLYKPIAHILFQSYLSGSPSKIDTSYTMLTVSSDSTTVEGWFICIFSYKRVDYTFILISDDKKCREELNLN